MKEAVFLISKGMTDPCILTTPAFRLIKKDVKGAIQEGPTYIFDIF